MLPTLDQIETATAFVHESLPPTPQICWPLLNHRVGTEVWVKHENHQPVGAFKVRGGLVLLKDIASDPDKPTGIISATRGNHGQSLAFAAQRHGIQTSIVVPHGNSLEKNAAMRALDAELIEHGDDFTAAAEHAIQLAEKRGLVLVPSFHPLLVRGVASYWLEYFRAVADLDTVYVPIGLGSGICAGIAVRDALNLRTTIVGVVSKAAPAYALSFDAKKPVSHPVSGSIADGVSVRDPASEAIDHILKGVDRVVKVDDDEIKAAMHAYFVDTHNVAEGAGAAALAALLQERTRMQGKKTGVILTGCNVDHDIFARVLTSATL